MPRKRPPKEFKPVIESGIPIPPRPRPTRSKNIGTRIIWPFDSMEVGDSCAVPEWGKKDPRAMDRVSAAISKAKRDGRLVGMEFEIRRMQETGQLRVWRTK